MVGFSTLPAQTVVEQLQCPSHARSFANRWSMGCSTSGETRLDGKTNRIADARKSASVGPESNRIILRERT